MYRHMVVPPPLCRLLIANGLMTLAPSTPRGEPRGWREQNRERSLTTDCSLRELPGGNSKTKRNLNHKPTFAWPWFLALANIFRRPSEQGSEGQEAPRQGCAARDRISSHTPSIARRRQLGHSFEMTQPDRPKSQEHPPCRRIPLWASGHPDMAGCISNSNVR